MNHEPDAGTLRKEHDNKEPAKPNHNTKATAKGPHQSYWTRWEKVSLPNKLTVGCTFVIAAATVFYALFAYRQLGVLTEQLRAMLKANEQTKTALHVSERAYVVVGPPHFDLVKKAISVPLNNNGRIPSGDVEVVIHEATINQTIPASPVIISAAMEHHWKRHRLPPFPPGNTFSFVVPTPAASEERLRAATQAIVIAGRVTYNDGFPEDELQGVARPTVRP